MNKNAYSTIDLSVCSSAQKGVKMKFSNLEAIRDWCKDKFQPKGNYLTEVPIATDESIGAVKPDGETIKIGEDGTISASQNADITPENIDSLWAKGYWSLSEDGTFNEKVPFRPGFARMWVSEANGTTDAYKAGKYLGMSGQIIVLNSGVSSGYIFQIFFNPATGDIAIRKNVVQNELTFTYDTPIQHVFEKNKVPSAIYNNGYWGIGIPWGASDRGAYEFLRIAAQGGLIPYQQDGASALGTSAWPWKDIWGQGIHGNTGAFSGSVTANTGAFSGNVTANTGAFSGSVTANGVRINNTGNAPVVITRVDSAGNAVRRGTLQVSANNNLGLWDDDNKKWICFAAPDGSARFLGNADTATKATSDSDGNVIADTYLKPSEKGMISGGSTININFNHQVGILMITEPGDSNNSARFSGMYLITNDTNIFKSIESSGTLMGSVARANIFGISGTTNTSIISISANSGYTICYSFYKLIN